MWFTRDIDVPSFHFFATCFSVAPFLFKFFNFCYTNTKIYAIPAGVAKLARLDSRSSPASPKSRRVDARRVDALIIMYYVYILRSKTSNKTYAGITDNLDRRLQQHNYGYHFYTKRYCPWVLLYREKYKNRDEARKREKYLKSAAGRRWLKKTLFKN